MANAELIISPEVSISALEKSMEKIDKEIKTTADSSQKYFESSLDEAGKKGGKKMGLGIKAGIAGAMFFVGKSLMAGVSVLESQVGMGDDVISNMLGERDASNMLSFASSQGFSEIEMASFMSRMMRNGGDEQTGMDFIVDTSDFINQAKAGDNTLLSGFTEFKGLEQFNAVLASLSSISGEKDRDKFNKFLADMGWAGDVGVISSMLSELDGRTGKDAFKYLNKKTNEDKINAQNTAKEAKLEKEFANMIRSVNIKTKTGLLHNLNSDSISSYKMGLESKQRDEINSIKNYAINKRALETELRIKKEIDNGLSKIVQWILVEVMPYFNKYMNNNFINKLEDKTIETANTIAKDIMNFVTGKN